MSARTPLEIWTDCCKATVDIRVRHGVPAAVDYLVGEKLMVFAQMGESDPQFLAELPAFSQKIRSMFTSEQIAEYFARADDADRVEPDIFKGATPEDIEALEESFADDRRNAERRQWVRAMLLRTGS